MDNGEVIPFREAVFQWILELYDDECKEVLDEAMKGKYDHFQFNELAAMVFGVFLGDLYTDNREKFIELAKPIYEEYCKIKKEEDAHWRREQMKMLNLHLVKNKNSLYKRQLKK